MKILALDTSTEWCSVAVGEGGRWHARDEHAGQMQSDRLLPMVAAALADAGWTLADVDGVAFGAGPGSFTGLRIGCGVAQGLALGLDCPVVPVPTLAAIAHATWRARGDTRIVTCLDARMREVYVAAYERRDDAWIEAAPAAVMSPSAVLLPFARGWVGAGNGFAAYPAMVDSLGLTAVDADARPTAQAIGELALARFAADEGVAAGAALPLYVRHRIALTSAERAAGARL
ncbi:MAG: tRNA (adenosine(37)-N6)-threonylcarbamoyltransferase complex dimerization subunit type 1 TsaB [Betaproteobacteria bacterium]